MLWRGSTMNTDPGDVTRTRFRRPFLMLLAIMLVAATVSLWQVAKATNGGTVTAYPFMKLHRDSVDYSATSTWDGTGDGATGVIVGISEVHDQGGSPVTISLGAYQAELRYATSCISILEVREGRDFTLSASNIDDPSGLAQFNGVSVSGDEPDSIMAFALVRLIGDKNAVCNLEVVFTSLTDVDGASVPIDSTQIVGEFRRGNAREDGTVNIADVLFGAQHLAELRGGCVALKAPGASGDLTCMNPVNLAGVNTDGDSDLVTVADHLFVAQQLVGLRDESYVIATATPTATPTPTPAPTPPPGGPAGSVAVAVTILGARSGYPGTCTANCTEEMVQTSVLETLVKVNLADSSGTMPLDPALATGWTLDPGLEFVDFTIRQGVQFHDGWGELTAEDVVFSLNAANRATNPESISGQGGELAAMVANTEVIDTYTARVHFSVFDARWLRFRFSDFEESIGINSKAVFDTYGAEGMRDVIVGTGPYKAIESQEYDRAVLEAVPDHWRRTPSVQAVKIFQVLEPAAQLAMMQTGFIAAGRASLDHWPSLIADYGFVKAQGTGFESILAIGWCGNYWEKTSARTGEVLVRTRDTSLPWVGNPFELGDTYDENTPSMQNSLKVRQALARAIDREGLNTSLQAGLGQPAYFSYQPANDSPLFKQGTWPAGWEIPYDLPAAKALLADAGYSGGFDMTVWVSTSDTLGAEAMEALAGLWQAELGVNVSLERTAYVIFRPGLVDRSNTKPYLSPGDGASLNNPMSAARGFTMSSWSDGGYGVGMEIPFAADNYVLTAQEPDAQTRIDANVAFIQESIDWELASGLVSTPGYVLIDPDIIAAWQFHAISNGALNAMHNFEYIVLK